jgi:hypothetical protein
VFTTSVTTHTLNDTTPLKAHKQEAVNRLLEMIELQAGVGGDGDAGGTAGLPLASSADGVGGAGGSIANCNLVRRRGKKVSGGGSDGGNNTSNDRTGEHDTLLLIQVGDDNVPL